MSVGFAVAITAGLCSTICVLLMFVDSCRARFWMAGLWVFAVTAWSAYMITERWELATGWSIIMTIYGMLTVEVVRLMRFRAELARY